jgi:hypothetical protein
MLEGENRTGITLSVREYNQLMDYYASSDRLDPEEFTHVWIPRPGYGEAEAYRGADDAVVLIGEFGIDKGDWNKFRREVREATGKKRKNE